MNRFVGSGSEPQANDSIFWKPFKWIKSLLSLGDNHTAHQPSPPPRHVTDAGSPTTEIENDNALDQDDDIYNAERILQKRIVNGRIYYLIKWQGYSAKHNTWEPEWNIMAPELLAEFQKLEEKKRNKTGKVAAGRKRSAQVALDSPQVTAGSDGAKKKKTTRQGLPRDMDGVVLINSGMNMRLNFGCLTGGVGDAMNPDQPTGFHRGFQPQEILHAEMINGELLHWIKWEDSDITECVAARESNQKCPQHVIAFYQARLVCGKQDR